MKESILKGLTRAINEAEENYETLNLKEITKQSLATVIKEMKEFEIEFTASCTDEVGGSIDYVNGGLTGTYMTDEEDRGYITFEHPFIKQDGDYKIKEDEWIIECHWETDHFEVKEKANVEKLDDIYDFILDIQDRFDTFELETIYW